MATSAIAATTAPTVVCPLTTPTTYAASTRPTASARAAAAVATRSYRRSDFIRRSIAEREALSRLGLAATQRSSPLDRRSYVASAVLLIAAVATRLYQAQLPGATLRDLAIVVILAIPYAAVAIVIRASRQGATGAVQLALTTCNLLIVAAFLAAVAPRLPDLPGLAFALLGSVVITTEAKAHRIWPLLLGAIAYVALLSYWIQVAPTKEPAPDAGIFVVWGGLLVAFLILLQRAWVEAEFGLSGKMAMLDATADAASRLGLAHDEGSVAQAVLTACASAYPQSDFAELWVLTDEESLRIVRAPVAGRPEPTVVLRKGQSYPGYVLETGEEHVWPDLRQASVSEMPKTTAPELASRDARVRSVVATPLRLQERGVIGVLALYSRKRNAFDADDLVVVRGLANQATLGLERANLYQEQLQHATTDPLTNLANRRAFETRLRAEVSRTQRARGRLAILYCDLDNFKEFNDVLGHAVGDRVLRLFADTLRANLRAEDTAARPGGDEFVCLLPGADKDLARVVALRVSEKFLAAIAADPTFADVRTAVTIGWAAFPGDGATAEALMSAADQMLLDRKELVAPTSEPGGEPSTQPRRTRRLKPKTAS